MLYGTKSIIQRGTIASLCHDLSCKSVMMFWNITVTGQMAEGYGVTRAVAHYEESQAPAQLESASKTT